MHESVMYVILSLCDAFINYRVAVVDQTAHYLSLTNALSSNYANKMTQCLIPAFLNVTSLVYNPS